MFWALKKSVKTVYWRSKHWILETLNFEFPIDVLKAYGLLVVAYVVCHKSNVKQFYFSK